MEILKAIRGLCRRALSIFDAKKPKKALWNLKPEVEAAFRAAWKPVEREQSRGGVLTPVSYVSRMRRWVVRQPTDAEKLKGLKPVTYKRAAPKRDMSVSARQAKRMRTAACRCTA